jgi:hypothetical protein
MSSADRSVNPADHVERLERSGEAPTRTIRSTQQMLEENRGPGTIQIVRTALLAVLVLVAILAVLFVIGLAFDTDDRPSAPWAAPNAPAVTPLPINGQ